MQGGTGAHCQAPLLGPQAEDSATERLLSSDLVEGETAPKEDSDKAVCGAAAGQAAALAPSKDLCATGTPAAVTGGLVWTWSCAGKSGEKTACSAPLSHDGQCGRANGFLSADPPSVSDLCAAGSPSVLTQNADRTAWIWVCESGMGGETARCSAPLSVNALEPRLSEPQTFPMPSSASASVVDTSETAPTPKTEKTQDLLVAPSSPAQAKGEVPAAPAAKPALSSAIPPAKPDLMPDLPAAHVPPRPDLTAGEVPETSPNIAENQAEVPLPEAASTLKTPDMPAPQSVGTKESAHALVVLDPSLSSIPFAIKAVSVPMEAKDSLSKLAKLLQQHEATRITLFGYAGTGANTPPREAREISLQRVLSLRDYLVGKGVASNRIDVRALGANVPSGSMDRVDISINR